VYTHPIIIPKTPTEKHDSDDVSDMKQLIKLVISDVVTSADVLFTKLIVFTHKLARGFREKYNFVAIKAGSCTVLDFCIVWKGAKVRLILAGDLYKLPPTVMSTKAKIDGSQANAFPWQLQIPLLQQLICSLRLGSISS
jgi:hypothetical protein